MVVKGVGSGGANWDHQITNDKKPHRADDRKATAIVKELLNRHELSRMPTLADRDVARRPARSERAVSNAAYQRMSKTRH